MSLITDEMVSNALDYLASSIDEAAAAKAQRVRAERRVERVRSSLVLSSEHSSAALRDAWARAHPDYAAACEAEARAVEADEWHRNARNNAEAVIEAWRTMNANARAAERLR